MSLPIGAGDYIPWSDRFPEQARRIDEACRIGEGLPLREIMILADLNRLAPSELHYRNDPAYTLLRDRFATTSDDEFLAAHREAHAFAVALGRVYSNTIGRSQIAAQHPGFSQLAYDRITDELLRVNR